MSSISIEVTTAKSSAELGSTHRILPSDARNSREVCIGLSELFARLAAGMETGTVTVSLSTSDAVAAWGTLTISSGSGSVGGTIAGTAKTVTWATSDTASAAALAAAINADATLKALVYATSAAGVVTLIANDLGVLGNQITLVASGTGVTAGHLSGGKFTGGTGNDGIPTAFVRS